MADNIIMDHFDQEKRSFITICDSSLNNYVVDMRLQVYQARKAVEDIYRALYEFGYLEAECDWVISLNQNDGMVFFELNLTHLLKSHPELQDNLKTVLSLAESKEIWDRLCKMK